MTDYDDTLIDPDDRFGYCATHSQYAPCEECKKVTQDEQADWGLDR